MSAEQSGPKGPDLSEGIGLVDIADGGMVGGHVGDDAVLLARRGSELFAIGATCSHYGGPLAEGLIVAETVRCPWHHACFSLRTGEAVAAPAFNPMPCWRVETREGKAFVREKIDRAREHKAASRGAAARTPTASSSWVAGPQDLPPPRCSAAKDLRGSLTMLSSDDAAALRPPQLLQGLSRRKCTGRLDAAAAAGIFQGAEHRSSARHRRSPQST